MNEQTTEVAPKANEGLSEWLKKKAAQEAVEKEQEAKKEPVT